MPIKSLFGKTFHAIEESLEITKKRHGLITSNIDKLNTQVYRTKGIDFKNALKNAMEGKSFDLFRVNPRHFSSMVSNPEPPIIPILTIITPPVSIDFVEFLNIYLKFYLFRLETQ